MVGHELSNPQVEGVIFQINLSEGGVPKWPVRHGVVTPLGLSGDLHRNTKSHGGPERALCLYSLERIMALQREGHPVFPGALGENLTLFGLDWAQVRVGMQLRLGENVLVQVTRFTTPCNNILDSFLEGDISRVSQERNPGWSRVYTRVLREGEIRIGDRVILLN